MGEESGNDLTSSDHNVAIGFQAFAKATASADNNTVVGNYAMGSIISEDVNDCVVLGYNAIGLGVMESGASGVVAVGRDALKSLTSGAGNTAIGHTSGADVTTGFSNTLIGYNAGNTGTVDLVGGNSNTYIGFETRGSSGSAINQTVIGKGAVGQGNNLVVLGNADVTAVYMAQDKGAVVHTAGIQFPSGQVANGDANALDDYEEGDHDPTTVVGASGGDYTVDSTNDVLRYTKIGRLVNIQGLILITGDNSASGQLRISLPFTIGDGTGLSGRSYGSAYLSGHGSGSSGTTPIEGKVYAKLEEGNAFFTLVEVNDDGTDNDIDNTDVDGAFNIGVNFSYTV